MIADPEPTLRSRPWQAVSAWLIVASGLLGLGGVAVSAASSHAGGGPLGQTAGTFLLLHAAVVLGIASLVTSCPRPAVLAVAGGCLTLGVALFAGDLSLAGLGGLRPFPLAAPIGGGLLLIGWLMVVIGGALTSSRV